MSVTRPIQHAPAVCAYVRISDDRTGENASPRRQRAAIVELAKRQGIDPETIRWFEEPSTRASASKGPRPAFVDLMDAVRAGEVLVVLIGFTDRLWRNDEDDYEVRRVFRAAKVKIKSAGGNDFDFGTAEGRFTGKVVGAASSYEVERKSERILLSTVDRATKGRFGGGVRRFGYQQIGTRIRRTMDDAGVVTEELRPAGPLSLVSAEAEAIANGYKQISGGASLNSVTRDWRARGLTGVQGGPLTPMVVRSILLRPANAGISTYKGEIVGKGEWPAIVEPDVYADVKALLESPARRTNVGRPTVHLLSGILRCGTCAGRMLAGSKARGQTYRCRSGRQLPETKVGIHASRRRANLEAAISEIVVNYIAANADRLTRPTNTTDKHVAQAINDAAALRAKIEAYQAQAADFEPADLAGLLRGLRAKLAAVEAKVVKAAGTPATQALVSSGDIPTAWATLDTAGRRVVIKENVDRIEVGPGKPGSTSATLHNVVVIGRDGAVIFPAPVK